MQAFELRVIEELNELNLKMNALNAFMLGKIFQSLDPIDQQLLGRQLDVMGAYRNILEQRIQRFK